MKGSKVFSLLSIARKAGKVKSGEFSAERSVKAFKSCLVVIASDASENTSKKFTDMCSFHEVPYIVYGQKEELGRCIGCDIRSVISVEDRGLADAVRKAAEA